MPSDPWASVSDSGEGRFTRGVYPAQLTRDRVLRVCPDLQWQVWVRVLLDGPDDGLRNQGLSAYPLFFVADEERLTNNSPRLFVCKTPGRASAKFLLKYKNSST